MGYQWDINGKSMGYQWDINGWGILWVFIIYYMVNIMVGISWIVNPHKSPRTFPRGSGKPCLRPDRSAARASCLVAFWSSSECPGKGSVRHSVSIGSSGDWVIMGHHGSIVLINGEFPIAGWFIMESPIKMNDLEVPPFEETPILEIWLFCSWTVQWQGLPLTQPAL